MDLLNSLAELEARFAECEQQVQAFLPEAGRFARLRREARQLLDRYPDPQSRPALFGVLVGVKDIFHVAGFETRAGSRLPPGLFQGAEAASVSRLKAVGALVLGKTVTTEFAYFAPGPARNPHNPAHTPGGSSSGSAAAVAAGLCPLALGTQTIGSLIRPAAFCGVVGFKPTYGRISPAGVIPLSASLDHVGFFAPDVAGAQRAAPCLYQDWRVGTPAPHAPVLGIPTGDYLEHAGAEALAHFESACQRLISAGFIIRRVPAMPDFALLQERHNLIVAAEAARFHAAWFEQYAPLYAARTAQLVRRGQAVSAGELADALAGRDRLRSELDELMDAHSIDLWISPAAPGPAPHGLESTGDPVMNLPWTHAGLPAINLPSSLNGAGLPMGLQVAGRWYADEHLLSWAGVLERALDWKRTCL